MNLKGKNLFITGGSRGIGLAIAKRASSSIEQSRARLAGIRPAADQRLWSKRRAGSGRRTVPARAAALQ
jgi:NAD(P)-dependent dehydrogenase (short-subunit alcohol dehydrogenase family)